jgi:hypothetical protein
VSWWRSASSCDMAANLYRQQWNAMSDALISEALKDETI